MKKLATEQELFWAGKFGDEYASRNQGENVLADDLGLFAKILSRTEKIDSILEYGANIGENLKAINLLLPNVKLSAIEINKSACEEIKKWSNGKIKVFQQSILEFKTVKKYDLVFSKGVLIHINPDELKKVYNSLYKTSNKYILICEYYNPVPVGVDYRGHKNRLFKRDFCGEIMDLYPNLKLIDYGFTYHRDQHFPQDDSTWFLLEK